MSGDTRRKFIATLGIGASAALGGLAGYSPGGLRTDRASSEKARRADEVLRRRRRAALLQRQQPLPLGLTNGDEERYAEKVANYSKGLPHTETGQVDLAAYEAMLKALRSGRSRDFSMIPLAGNANLVNPQAAFTFTLKGADSHHLDLAPAPAFASAEAAADLVEVYWQALLRDIPFSEYPVNDLALRACEDLTQLSGFCGPKQGGRVTSGVLFRGELPGDAVGPFVSQFLYARIPHGVFSLEQRFRMPIPRVDFGTLHESWLAMQRGGAPETTVVLERQPRFIRTGRDLARYVQRDYSFQAFLNAALLLIGLAERYTSANPYVRRACAFAESRRTGTEDGFCTFGGPGILGALTAVASLALYACWSQKWLLHRRLRPEEFAQRVDRHVKHGTFRPIHWDLLDSAVLTLLPEGSLLLPLAYPEGAPLHPSYPAGHAALAGACATVLKAFFREDEEFPAPVDVSEDGSGLVAVSDGGFTVGSEINKLASNISIGRNFAGIHYRTDAIEGLRLGEAVALSYLADLRLCLTEDFDGFTFRRFDGTVVNV